MEQTANGGDTDKAEKATVAQGADDNMQEAHEVDGDVQEVDRVECAGKTSVSMTLVEIVKASAVNDITLDENAIHIMRHVEVKEEWDKKERDSVKGKVWDGRKREEPMYEWKEDGVWRLMRGRRLRVPPIKSHIPLICEFHDREHYDTVKTVNELRCNFWWNGMGMHVDKYCKNCGTCALGVSS